jgi:hypothetical protein
MTQPEDDPNSYPSEWGYRPAAKGAIEAAVDVYASSMTDDEFDDFVARVRPTGGR